LKVWLCAGFGRSKPGKKKAGPLDWWFNSRAPKKGEPRALARTTPMRIEPKTFFANERTFLSWLHMAVSLPTPPRLDGLNSVWLLFADDSTAKRCSLLPPPPPPRVLSCSHIPHI